ncbi:MAG: hypothetical protein AUJ92_10170 [Armatimonadetes bacterium CG2_30_59_28]|nr:MAG: hypothetical protein AUJ92_10170 [Armatimonadetes bacterium CG2_30_59_28]
MVIGCLDPTPTDRSGEPEGARRTFGGVVTNTNVLRVDSMIRNRAVVIGIDGATFDLINGWVDEGKLPTLGRLMAEGVHGNLKSVHNMRSASAWTSFATGKNPGSHGIFDFWHRVPGSYGIRFVNRRTRSGKALWDHVCHAGGKSIVINVPMTYPADSIDGVMVCGMDAPGIDSEGFCHPPEVIQQIIDAAGGYIIEPGVTSLCMSGKYAEAVDLTLKAVDLRFKAASYLMDSYPWDLLVVVFRETDPIQHSFWKFMDTAHPEHHPELAVQWGDAILRVYQQIDTRVGELLDNIGSETPFFIMSDHGFGANQGGNEHLPAWLEGLGHLRFKSPGDGKRFSRLRELMEPVIVHGASFIVEQVHRRTSRPMKERLTRRFPVLREKLQAQLSLRGIDWSQTRAFADGARENIRINLRGREPEGIVEPGEEYENLLEFLRSELMSATDVSSGTAVAQSVLRGSDVYSGEHLEQAADLIVEWRDDVFVSGIASPGTRSEMVCAGRKVSYMPGEESRFISGYHRPFGIFISGGRGIKRGIEVHGASIVDIAPTVLHAMGLPVPEDMEGRVLTEILEGGATVTKRVSAPDPGLLVDDDDVYSDEDSEKIAERLRGLGYL